VSSARPLATGPDVGESPCGFEVRWYHLGEQRHGPFADLAELAGYMAERRLPRPDELLVREARIRARG
jgi:hypothetical protein